MKKWFRLVVEILLFGSLIGSGVFIYLQMSQIESLEDDLAGKESMSSNSVASSQNSQQAKIIDELTKKSKEYDAVKTALSGGQALLDIEAAAAKAKVESPERYLAIGALRLLVKGKDDPSTAAAFEKALDMVQWNSKLKSVCAAQAGMAASGKNVGMLSDCSRLDELEKIRKNSLDEKSSLTDQNPLPTGNNPEVETSQNNEAGV
tara:strand:+ start:55 stop:669 length:615 start_codon:yes stop_codon:yes gene_type:complete